jgi:hypothetical protein
MVLGTEERVRQFGGAHDTTELSSADVTAYLKIGTRRVIDLTGRSEAEWVGPPAHPDKDTADMAASYFAAMHVVHRFSSIDNQHTQAIEYNKVATILCESINRGASEPGSGGNPSIVSVRGAYRTSRLNASAEPFKSTY